MAGLEDFRVCFLLEDPFADASKRLDPVLRASYVHHCCSAERDDPLGALKSEAVAHPSLQLFRIDADGLRSEEHTSELQSLMRISYAVFCLKKKKINTYLAIHLYFYSSD